MEETIEDIKKEFKIDGHISIILRDKRPIGYDFKFTKKLADTIQESVEVKPADIASKNVRNDPDYLSAKVDEYSSNKNPYKRFNRLTEAQKAFLKKHIDEYSNGCLLKINISGTGSGKTIMTMLQAITTDNPYVLIAGTPNSLEGWKYVTQVLDELINRWNEMIDTDPECEGLPRARKPMDILIVSTSALNPEGKSTAVSIFNPSVKFTMVSACNKEDYEGVVVTNGKATYNVAVPSCTMYASKKSAKKLYDETKAIVEKKYDKIIAFIKREFGNITDWDNKELEVVPTYHAYGTFAHLLEIGCTIPVDEFHYEKNEGTGATTFVASMLNLLIHSGGGRYTAVYPDDYLLWNEELDSILMESKRGSDIEGVNFIPFNRKPPGEGTTSNIIYCSATPTDKKYLGGTASIMGYTGIPVRKYPGSPGFFNAVYSILRSIEILKLLELPLDKFPNVTTKDIRKLKKIVRYFNKIYREEIDGDEGDIKECITEYVIIVFKFFGDRITYNGEVYDDAGNVVRKVKKISYLYPLECVSDKKFGDNEFKAIKAAKKYYSNVQEGKGGISGKEAGNQVIESVMVPGIIKLVVNILGQSRNNKVIIFYKYIKNIVNTYEILKELSNSNKIKGVEEPLVVDGSVKSKNDIATIFTNSPNNRVAIIQEAAAESTSWHTTKAPEDPNDPGATYVITSYDEERLKHTQREGRIFRLGTATDCYTIIVTPGLLNLIGVKGDRTKFIDVISEYYDSKMIRKYFSVKGNFSKEKFIKFWFNTITRAQVIASGIEDPDAKITHFSRIKPLDEDKVYQKTYNVLRKLDDPRLKPSDNERVNKKMLQDVINILHEALETKLSLRDLFDIFVSRGDNMRVLVGDDRAYKEYDFFAVGSAFLTS